MTNVKQIQIQLQIPVQIHGVGLGLACVVQVRQGAGHQVVASTAGEGRHGREGGAGKESCSNESILDFTRSPVGTKTKTRYLIPCREGGCTG